MKIVSYIKGLFGVKIETKKESILLQELIPCREEVTIHLPEIRLVSTYDKNKPSILIIDDSRGIISIIEDYLNECKINTKDYNILSFYGNFAPFVMIDTLEILKEMGLTKIDYSIIDMVLPGKKKVHNEFIKYDGVDVAVYLNTNFEMTNFVFYTGNIISVYVEFIKEKMIKFQSHFNKNMTDHVIFKGNITDEDTVKEFCKLITKEKYVL